MNRAVTMAMVEEREERDEEREGREIQLHRLYSRSQTIYVCKEERKKGRNKGKKEGK